MADEVTVLRNGEHVVMARLRGMALTGYSCPYCGAKVPTFVKIGRRRFPITVAFALGYIAPHCGQCEGLWQIADIWCAPCRVYVSPHLWTPHQFVHAKQATAEEINDWLIKRGRLG